MKKPIRLTVNGTQVSAQVEPRLQLADFLREELLLTGTHLGCEHGVCGACTVEVDGAPARSCIAYAVACDGAHVRTIEGYDDDAVMAQLREAFSAEHALQCGYCTPGMLVTARDIVLRLPDANEARIREELSGNLCRCTGYVGIVRAIQSVITGRNDKHALAPDTGERARVRGWQTPVEPSRASAAQAKHSLAPATGEPTSAVSTKPALAPVTGERIRVRGTQAPIADKPQTTLHQSFSVDHPRERVWAFFGRLDEVTTCLPGATVRGAPTHDHVDMSMRVRVGPIVAEFEGAADVERDHADYSGLIRGAARDARSDATTHGEIRYVLLEEKSGAATRVELDVAFALTGALAQFGRAGLVQDIAKRMTAAFAQNLEARLSQRDSESSAERPPTAPVAELNALSLVFSVVWNRLKGFFRTLFGR